MSSSDQVSVSRVIPAPAEAIFDILADPGRHQEIDGSGTVQGAHSATPRRLKLGDTFGMSMRMGVPYSTRNVVVEFEDNRRIAWRTLAAPLLTLLFTGRTWRYVLEPVEGGTRVTETWDISTEAALSRPLVRAKMTTSTRTAMERTLERIEQVLSA
jgi:uncharacterized protein YndB with AHSA1/START domain